MELRFNPRISCPVRFKCVNVLGQKSVPKKSQDKIIDSKLYPENAPVFHFISRGAELNKQAKTTEEKITRQRGIISQYSDILVS